MRYKIDRSSADLPNWIPLQIIWVVNRLLGDDSAHELNFEEQGAAASLCIDERMQTVWREVFRKSQGGGYLHPAKIEALNPYSRAIEWMNKLAKSLDRLHDKRSSAELRTLRRGPHPVSLTRT